MVKAIEMIGLNKLYGNGSGVIDLDLSVDKVIYLDFSALMALVRRPL